MTEIVYVEQPKTSLVDVFVFFSDADLSGWYSSFSHAPFVQTAAD